MENNKFIVIIPARFASTRFPGKPLAMLGGSTVIRRVYEQAEKAIDNVIVATDDERIFNHVNSFGKAVMTGSHHRSGTDRCWEAYQINGGNEDIIINVQGDEPFIQPDQIKAIMQCFDDATTDIATLIKPFDQQGSYTDLEDSNKVKVVTDIKEDFERTFPVCREVTQLYRDDISQGRSLVQLVLRLVAPLL